MYREETYQEEAKMTIRPGKIGEAAVTELLERWLNIQADVTRLSLDVSGLWLGATCAFLCAVPAMQQAQIRYFSQIAGGAPTSKGEVIYVEFGGHRG